MKREFIDLAKYRLEKANNTLTYAKTNVEDAFLDSTVNRIYYAVFYSDMFDRRQRGDYKDFVKFEKPQVEDWLVKAGDFINKIEILTLNIIDAADESVSPDKE
ncbi:MAG: hypothetical protein Q7J59_02675 [Elusimicrobiota bacterium]|nr:hypothetical protein [Elusimicrobiota bacterium]